ncbi:MAG: hypothetical protein K8R88_07645, partial [Armatimonadetes bacterium]|nr:hypothetical protein [Armatimonadota bacterium]
DVSPGGPVRSVVEGQLEKMNPIIKASDLPIALEFTAVSLQEGQIRLSAKLKPSPPIEIPEP